MRKLFRQATTLMDLKDHEFVGNPTSPPFAFLPCHCHMGISLFFGKRVLGALWDPHGCEKPKSK